MGQQSEDGECAGSQLCRDIVALVSNSFKVKQFLDSATCPGH